MLRGIYDRAVEQRERTPAPSWETPPRDAFAALLQTEGVRTLLELGAATGRDGLYFREQGFDPAGVEALPEQRQQLYNWQRNSKVFVKRL